MWMICEVVKACPEGVVDARTGCHSRLCARQGQFLLSRLTEESIVNLSSVQTSDYVFAPHNSRLWLDDTLKRSTIALTFCRSGTGLGWTATASLETGDTRMKVRTVVYRTGVDRSPLLLAVHVAPARAVPRQRVISEGLLSPYHRQSEDQSDMKQHRGEIGRDVRWLWD